LRWDWTVVVLQHATDPRIKQVVVQTAAHASHQPNGRGAPVGRMRPPPFQLVTAPASLTGRVEVVV
jgi:hypothetical protein